VEEAGAEAEEEADGAVDDIDKKTGGETLS
jgi:hypothetical protein